MSYDWGLVVRLEEGIFLDRTENIATRHTSHSASTRQMPRMHSAVLSVSYTFGKPLRPTRPKTESEEESEPVPIGP